MLNLPFWALAVAKDGSIGDAHKILVRFAAQERADGNAFRGIWQDEICHLNGLIPEIDVDWVQVMPGTQLMLRGGDEHGEDKFCFVLESDPMESDRATVVLENGRIDIISLNRDSDGIPIWQEAGQ